MKTDNINTMNLNPGDHVAVRRGGGLFGIVEYVHHGIYIGDGRIVEFNGEGIGVVSKNVFFKGAKEKYIIKYNNPYPADIVVRTAKSFIGVKGYKLALRNCEHFATFCKTGSWDSYQVSTLSPGAIQKEVV